MPTFFLILLAPHLFISIATAQPRRLLHQPFVPQDTISPTESPSPPDRPFFPTEPSSSSSSPPPLSPRTVASFPANISSLSIPHSDSSNSKSSSPKLVVLAVVAAISALLLTAVFILVYFRRRQRRRRSVGVKSHRPDNSPGLHSTVKQRTVPRVSSTNTSSEFLYLGTIINSRPIEDPSTNRKNAAGKAGLSPYKSGSPELRPLPPLTRQSCGQYPPYEDLGSSVNGEEEFYSPRASLGGRESSSPTGSGSRRAISAIEVENFEGKSTDSSSSCSSSVSGSPTRSHSVSISPPVSSSPKSRKLEFNATPELAPQQLSETQFHYSEKLHLPSCSPSLHSLSPDRIIAKSNGVSIRPLSPEPGFYKSSDAYSQSSSPDRGFSKYADVFSVSPSPERNLGKKFDETRRFSNLEAAYASPHASPPKRAFYKFSDACSNSSSPPRGMKRNSDESSRFSYPKSPDASSLCTSPEKAFHKFSDISSHSSSPERGPSYKCFDVSSHSSLPQKGVDKIPDLSPTPRLSDISDENSRSPERVRASPQRPVITTPPPPPPPPSIPLKATGGGSPGMPSLQPCQPGSRPPVLVTPARPFISNSTAEVSPMELSSTSKTAEKSEETPKPKLKPLHWDKVRASSDREMVWDHLRSSSFKLNEERIETLFVVNNSASTPKEAFKWPVQPSPNQENRILDPKKSQNIAILLRALNVTTEEVCEALVEGNVDALGTELLESLLKMAPNKEEERKLKEHKDDSPFKLGPAENFLKAVLDIPFAFKRIDSMLYIANFESEVEYLKRSFGTLEGACEELKSSRMFLKLLEAVLKTGNRMNVGTNRGDAQAFKLDTLLKLADVKGADGKTTLLHFVVQEIVRTEGARLSNQTPPPVINEDAKCRRLGLQVVCGLSSELADVKKAAGMDSDVLSNEVSKLSRGIGKIGEVIRLNGTSGTEEGNLKFCESMGRFVKMAQEEIVKIQALESVALSLVKEVTEYFHGNSAKEEAHPFRIFMVVRDFLSVLDRVCKEVGMINERTQITSVHKFPVPVNPTLPVPPPAVLHGRNQSSSSDDESSSP